MSIVVESAFISRSEMATFVGGVKIEEVHGPLALAASPRGGMPEGRFDDAPRDGHFIEPALFTPDLPTTLVARGTCSFSSTHHQFRTTSRPLFARVRSDVLTI